MGIAECVEIAMIGWFLFLQTDLFAANAAHFLGKQYRCTVQYHYTFSGQSYSVVSNYEKPTNGQNGTFYINPQDPEKHFTMFDGYVGLGIMGTGFIMLLFAGLLTALNKSRKEIKQ